MQLPSYLADKFDAFDDLAESKNSILSVISLEKISRRILVTSVVS